MQFTLAAELVTVHVLARYNTTAQRHSRSNFPPQKGNKRAIIRDTEIDNNTDTNTLANQHRASRITTVPEAYDGIVIVKGKTAT
jgi:hypothetical protein